MARWHGASGENVNPPRTPTCKNGLLVLEAADSKKQHEAAEQRNLAQRAEAERPKK